MKDTSTLEAHSRRGPVRILIAFLILAMVYFLAVKAWGRVPLPLLLGGWMVLGLLAAYVFHLRKGLDAAESRSAESAEQQGSEAEERRLALARLRQQIQGQQALLDAMPAMIWMKDRSNRILQLNRAAAAFWGKRTEDVEGRSAFEFGPGAEAQKDHEDDLAVMNSGRARMGSISNIDVPGRGCRWIKVDKVPFWDASHQTAGIMVVAEDITERRQAEVDAATARDAAMESARTKSSLLANVGREMEAPLNSLVGSVRLLLETPLNAGQKELVDTAQRAAESAQDVVSDISDFLKLESGKIDFQTSDFDLRDTVENAVERLAGRAQSKELEIASWIASDLPTKLVGDKTRLRQILLNLIGNAIKFTESGEVLVRALRESETGDTVKVRFEVRDTGIGVTRDQKQTLFPLEHPAQDAPIPNGHGTGMGLMITRRIVSLLGGSVGVDSEPGRGSTFWFTVRYVKQAAPAAPRQDKLAPIGQVRALIVDDNETSRKILHEQLAKWGVLSDSAVSGAEALSLLRSAHQRGESYQLALLDLRMPQMDGLSLAEEIRKHQEFESLRLVILSFIGTPLGDGERRRLQIDQWLTKPIRQEILYETLSSVLKEPSAPHPRSRKKSPPVRAPRAGFRRSRRAA